MSISDLTQTVNLTHSDAASKLFPDCADGYYFRIKSIELSVYKAAQGEGGLLEIKDSGGNTVWAVGVDATFNYQFDFGEQGLLVGQETGVQAIVDGAQNQASLWAHVVAHLKLK